MNRAIVAALLLASCGTGHQEVLDQGEWAARKTRFARCFEVLERGNQRKLIVFGSPDRNDTLAVLLFGGGQALEPQRLAVMSTTHLPFINSIGRSDRVVAAAWLDRVKEEYWKRRIGDGSVLELTGVTGNDEELIAAANVDATLDYPFGRSRVHSGAGSIMRIPVTEYLEEHPLGRAEWIRFFGSLLGAEKAADSTFDAIVRRYMAREKQSSMAHRPRIFFGSAWQGIWHVPSGQSYMARLITDAGGDYLFASTEGAGNQSIGLESVVASAITADRFGVILAHGGMVSALDMSGDTRLAGMPVMHSGAFYLDSERSDIFGKALLEPDVLLDELGCVFRDADCDASNHRYVFRPVQ